VTAPIWLNAAWTWLKKYWKWLLFPVGVAVYFIGRASAKTNISVVSPGLIGHEDVDTKLAAEAAQKKLDADESAAAQLSGIEADRSSKVSSDTQKQIDAIEAVKGDPEKVTDLLKQVGKDVEGDR